MATVVFICGPGRSGTTMVDVMLGHEPGRDIDRCFSCGEVYAWFRPYRSHHKQIVCSCCDGLCDVWLQLMNQPESLFHAGVVKTLGVEFVIDSSKELRWVWD